MRMRKKKNLDGRLLACAPVMVEQPQDYRGAWHTLFGAEKPLHLEIGCGKGRFILELARRHPEIHFVAVEREEGALVVATEGAMRLGLANLRFLSFDAAELGQIFAPGEVDRIYLNFSDPWPPNRQRRRRLTHADYLDVYDSILKEDGDLHFKTDNQRLFEWSLSSICEYGWLVQNISLDLHASAWNAENIMTEYEEKFSQQGFRICRLEARRRLPQFMERRRPDVRT